MKKIIRLVFVQIFVLGFMNTSYAQMQGLIMSNSERILLSTYVDNVDNMFTISKKLSNYEIITSYKDYSGIQCFCLTKIGTIPTIVSQIFTNLIIYDFEIKDGIVFLCGKGANGGFIGFISVADMFSNPIYKIEYIPNTQVVYDIDVYVDNNNSIKIGALAFANNYYYIDYNFSNGNTYSVLETPLTLLGITHTDNYVEVLCMKDKFTFGLFSHNKNNILQYNNRMYILPNNAFEFHNHYGCVPQDNIPRCFIESIPHSDNVVIALGVQDYILNLANGYNVCLFDINAQSLTLNTAKTIPTHGKPQIKDLKYDYNDNTFLLPTNVDFQLPNSATRYYVRDFIFKLPITTQQTTYQCELIMPNNSRDFKESLNSVVLYDENHYLVSGFDENNNSLYFFDRNEAHPVARCATSFNLDVLPYTLNNNGSISYTSNMTYYKSPITLSGVITTQILNTSCQY